MNKLLDTNTFDALITPEGAKAYLDNVRKSLGDVTTRIADKQDGSLRRGADMCGHAEHCNISLSDYTREAFSIVAAYADVGRSIDNSVEHMLSDERLRLTAMATAVITLLYGYNFRIAKEQFAAVAAEHGKGVQPDLLAYAFVVYLQQNKKQLSDEGNLTKQLVDVMTGRVYDELIDSMKHGIQITD